MPLTPNQLRQMRKLRKDRGITGTYNKDHVMGDESQRLSLEALSRKQHRRWLTTLSKVCDLMRWRSLTLEQASAVVYADINQRSGTRRGRRFRR